MAQAPLLDLVEAPLVSLYLTEVLSGRKPSNEFCIDASAGLHAAPEQFQFVVIRLYLRTDMSDEPAGVDAGVVALPTCSHAPVAISLAQAGWPADRPIILNPGHTGGALEFAHAFRSVRADVPPIAEFSTLTYVARKYRADGVTVSGRAKQVRAAAVRGMSVIAWNGNKRGGPHKEPAQSDYSRSTGRIRPAERRPHRC